MQDIFTIGFTKKSAKYFFEILKEKQIALMLDVRLNNTSQLSGFSKYPDIEYFLNSICNIQYINDVNFSPEEWVLKDYKSKKLTWNEYVDYFDTAMKERQILEYIKVNYSSFDEKNICLLCSEDKPDKCHRLLVAQRFKQVFGCNIIHL